VVESISLPTPTARILLVGANIDKTADIAVL
jgi:hypothetical protein